MKLRRDRDHSTNDLHRNLNILKVEDMHSSSILSLVHNCTNGKTIPAFEYYFITRETFQTIRTRNIQNIITYRCGTIGQKTVHDIGAHLWNNLSNELKNIESKNVFKKRIHNQYLTTYLDQP